MIPTIDPGPIFMRRTRQIKILYILVPITLRKFIFLVKITFFSITVVRLASWQPQTDLTVEKW